MPKTKFINHQFKNFKNSDLDLVSIFDFRSSILKSGIAMNRRGAIGILTTLALSAALVLIAAGVALNGISSRANAFNLSQTEKVFVPAEGCAEEALIRLNRDNGYTGGNFLLDNVSCEVSVSGSGEQRDIIVSGNKNNVTRDLLIRVQLIPSFVIIEWSD